MRSARLLTLFVTLFVAQPAMGIEILDLDATPRVISPDGHAAFDSLTITFGIDSNHSSAILRGVLMQDSTAVATIIGQDTVDVDIDCPCSFGWTGRDTSGATIADGTYDLVIHARDDDGEDADSVEVRIDTTPPELTLQLAGQSGPFRNGDFIALVGETNEEPDSIWADFSNIDTDSTYWDGYVISRSLPGVFGILYQISPASTKEDRASLPIRVWIRDGVYVETMTSLGVCLSNSPPRFESAFLIDAAGDSLDTEFVFTSGDTIRVKARIASPDTSVSSVFGNFSAIDSEFDPFLHPSVVDSTPWLEIPDSLRVGSDSLYAYWIDAYVSYDLHTENRRPEGGYEIFVTASDAACGKDTSDVIPATLADLGPEAPTLDSPASETYLTDRVDLSGTAPDAFRIEIERDGEAVAEAPVDSLTDGFDVTVPLVMGRNALTAVAFDQFGHASAPSSLLELFRLDDVRVRIASRVRPGDAIEVTLERRPTRIDLDIFNLSGDLIWQGSEIDPGEAHSFSWNGRNRSGELVLSGPYVARVTIHENGGNRAVNKAFVFTRK